MEPMIGLIVGLVSFFAAAVVSAAVIATLVAVFVRAFRGPLERWLEWMKDSFYGGGRR